MVVRIAAHTAASASIGLGGRGADLTVTSEGTCVDVCCQITDLLNQKEMMGACDRRGTRGMSVIFLWVDVWPAGGLAIVIRSSAELLYVRLRTAPIVCVRAALLRLPRTVNGTGHTGPSEFCATSI